MSEIATPVVFASADRVIEKPFSQGSSEVATALAASNSPWRGVVELFTNNLGISDRGALDESRRILSGAIKPLVSVALEEAKMVAANDPLAYVYLLNNFGERVVDRLTELDSSEGGSEKIQAAIGGEGTGQERLLRLTLEALGDAHLGRTKGWSEEKLLKRFGDRVRQELVCVRAVAQAQRYLYAPWGSIETGVGGDEKQAEQKLLQLVGKLSEVRTEFGAAEALYTVYRAQGMDEETAKAVVLEEPWMRGDLKRQFEETYGYSVTGGEKKVLEKRLGSLGKAQLKLAEKWLGKTIVAAADIPDRVKVPRVFRSLSERVKKALTPDYETRNSKAKLSKLYLRALLGMGIMGMGSYAVTRPVEALSLASVSDIQLLSVLGLESGSLPVGEGLSVGEGEVMGGDEVIDAGEGEPVVQAPVLTPPDEPGDSEVAQTSNLYEFFLSGQVGEFVEARNDRFNAMTPEEQAAFTERMGGNLERLQEGRITFAVLARDAGEFFGKSEYDRQEGRADLILVMTIDPKTKTMVILNIDRDLRVPKLWGDAINTMTWEDQTLLAGGIHQLYEPELSREILEDATGLPIDGVLTVNFDAFIAMTDAVFPQGFEVTVGAGEGYYNELTGVYYEEGKTYTFDGPGLIQYVRSRYTTSTFSREDRMTDVASDFLSQAVEVRFGEWLPQIREDPASIGKLISGEFDRLIAVVAQLEDRQERDLTMLWNLDVKVDGQEYPITLTQYLQLNKLALENRLKEPNAQADLIRLIGMTADEWRPHLIRFAPTTDPTSPAPLVQNSDKFIFAGGESTFWNPERNLEYWQPFRDWVQQVVGLSVALDQESLIPLTATETFQVPRRVMVLGDSIAVRTVDDFKNVLGNEAILGGRVVDGKNDEVLSEAYVGMTAVKMLDLLQDEQNPIPGLAEANTFIINLGANDFNSAKLVGPLVIEKLVNDLRGIIGELRAKNAQASIVIGQVLPSLRGWGDTEVVDFNRALDEMVAEVNRLNEEGGFGPVVIARSAEGFNTALYLDQDEVGGGLHPNQLGQTYLASAWARAFRALDALGKGQTQP